MSGRRSRDKGSEVEWRPIPGLSHYDISEFGDVRRNTKARTRRAGHVIKGSVGKCRGQGYRRYKLANGDGTKSIYFAHRLVAEAFIGHAPSPLHQIAHWDGDPLNNHYSNLRWATCKENAADTVRHGNSHFVGATNPKAKLTPAIVQQIREEYIPGYGNMMRLCRKHGIARTSMSYLLKRKNWAHVG